jgi:hypothetical protein
LAQEPDRGVRQEDGGYATAAPEGGHAIMRTIEAVKSNAAHIKKNADCPDSRSLASLLSELCDSVAQLREDLATLQRDGEGAKRKVH